MVNKLTRVHKAPTRVIVIDVLKPHRPTILDLGKALCAHKSVTNANLVFTRLMRKQRMLRLLLMEKMLIMKLLKR